jgi:hypothetical protein
MNAANRSGHCNADWNSSAGPSYILNKPDVCVIQRIRAQTNTAGVLTWTFPVAYDPGVIPNVQISVEDGTVGAIWNQQITALSNTSVTIRITKTTSVSVLGVNVLGVAANPQANVHITVTSP